MFHVNKALSFTVYYTVLIAAPLDISKQFMLKENKRIYAAILCLTGGMKYYFEAMFFDDNMVSIKEQAFEIDSFIRIANLLTCVCLLITIVRKEVGEIMHH